MRLPFLVPNIVLNPDKKDPERDPILKKLPKSFKRDPKRDFIIKKLPRSPQSFLQALNPNPKP